MKLSLPSLLRPSLLVAGLVLTGFTAGLALDLARDWAHPERVASTHLQRRELALRGNLELERAVQALKDSILRGDPSYGEEFANHMAEVDRALRLYRADGTLDREEEAALLRLRDSVPRYERTIHAVRGLRERDTPLGSIDLAVKGADRPVAAAFDELESAAYDPNALGPTLQREAIAVLAAAARRPAAGRAAAAAPDGAATGLLRWLEARDARVAASLHEGVCQSLCAALVLVRTNFAPEERNSNAALLRQSLQEALQDSLALATDLRPPPLQPDGLLASIEAGAAQSRRLRPELRVQGSALLAEDQIAPALKEPVLRLLRMALEGATADPSARQLQWTLAAAGAGEIRRLHLMLALEHLATPKRDAAAAGLAGALQARVTLAGGHNELLEEDGRGFRLEASWPLAVPAASSAAPAAA